MKMDLIAYLTTFASEQAASEIGSQSWSETQVSLVDDIRRKEGIGEADSGTGQSLEELFEEQSNGYPEGGEDTEKPNLHDLIHSPSPSGSSKASFTNNQSLTDTSQSPQMDANERKPSLSKEGWANSEVTPPGEGRAKIPPLKCSKYTIIGDPSLAKRKKAKGMQRDLPKWKVPVLPKLGSTMPRRVNLVDLRTIYSKRQDDLYQTLVREDVILPPLQCSPRMTELKPDPQLVQEKAVVMQSFFNTGTKRHFVNDRAIIPSVYSEFFQCPVRRKKYISAMYTEEYKKRNRDPVCFQSKYGINSECQYCEVMGSKYCSFCIEFKNRHFALWLEQNYLPSLAPGISRCGPNTMAIKGQKNGTQE